MIIQLKQSSLKAVFPLHLSYQIMTWSSLYVWAFLNSEMKTIPIYIKLFAYLSEGCHTLCLLGSPSNK